MKYTNNKIVTIIFLCINVLALHFPLITSDDKFIQDRTTAYTKIIQNWNSDSWQYGPMYKVVDRKDLIDTVFKDIRADNIKRKSLDHKAAIDILKVIATNYQSKPEHKTIIDSVHNYIQTTFAPDPEITPLATSLATTIIPFANNPIMPCEQKRGAQNSERTNPYTKSKKAAANNFLKFENINTYTILEACTAENQLLHKPLTISDDIKSIGDSTKHDIVQRNLGNYTIIHNVRGDGNCGYRAFLGSIFINSLDNNNFSGVQRLQTIVQEKCAPLFTKYTSKQIGSYKLTIPIANNLHQYTDLNYTQEEIKSIQQSMLQFLTEIQTYSSVDQIEELFNKHPKFDFFMIMFLRTLIADELSKKDRITERMIAIGARFDNEDANEAPSVTNLLQQIIMFLRTFITNKDEILYFTNLLRWQTWIDQPELAILNEVTGININLIQKDASNNPLTSWTSPTSAPGQADILFVDGNHYQILRGKEKHENVQ